MGEYNNDLFSNGKVEFECELVYDWKDADSTFATGSVGVVVMNAEDDESPEHDALVLEALEDVGRKFGNFFGNRCACLMVDKVNGQKVREQNVHLAVKDWVKANPGARFLELSGRIG